MQSASKNLDVGFVDLQVNGYAGVDFNDGNLTAESLSQACVRLTQDSVENVLLTVITDDLDCMCARLARIAELRQVDSLCKRVIHGVHIEGPFISREPGYVGAHPAHAVRRADIDSMNRLIDAAGGLVKMVTLAPECDPDFRVTRMLSDRGILVSAGHCDPTLDELDAAIDAGLSMFTHLGNGCPAMMHRHDNVIQRVLSRADRLHIGLIADGIHVPPDVLGNFIQLAGVQRCYVVTDAISAAGCGPGHYRLAGQDVVVDEEGGTWSADQTHLVGSSATMPTMAMRLKDSFALGDDEVADLTYHNPKSILGLNAK